MTVAIYNKSCNSSLTPLQRQECSEKDKIIFMHSQRMKVSLGPGGRNIEQMKHFKDNAYWGGNSNKGFSSIWI